MILVITILVNTLLLFMQKKAAELKWTTASVLLIYKLGKKVADVHAVICIQIGNLEFLDLGRK